MTQRSTIPMLLLMVMALVGALAEPPVLAGEVVIRIGSPFKEGHILVDAATKFKELAAQASGGRIEVQVQAGTASEEEINDWCSAGKIEMQSHGTMFLQSFAPQYYFFKTEKGGLNKDAGGPIRGSG